MKQRLINHYLEWSKKNPNYHVLFMGVARFFGFIFSGIWNFAKKNLDTLCLFVCTILLLILLYYTLNVYLRLFICVVLFVVASVGVSFLDFSERFFEDQIAAKQLSDARELMTLGDKPQSLAPSSNQPKTVFDPAQMAFANTVVTVGKLNQVPLETLRIDRAGNILQFVYRVPSTLKGNEASKRFNKMAMQLQSTFKLTGLPTFKLQGEEVTFNIDESWLAAASSVPALPSYDDTTE